MRKLTAAFLALAVLCSLSACGGDKGVSEDTKNELPALEQPGALEETDLLALEMEYEQRIAAMDEALNAAYESGDENAIMEAEAAMQELIMEYDRFMQEQASGGNGGNEADGDDEIYYPIEDEWDDAGWEDDGWDDGYSMDELYDERLFDTDWYHISEDVRTYHIKLYGLGDYQKDATFSVYDPRTDTQESYGFLVSEGYMDDPNDPTVAIVYTTVNPTYDIHTGGSYAEEIWYLEYIDGDMELRRYTIGEHGKAGDFIDSMLFTTTTPG